MPGDDRYTYPNSGGVLRNLLGITDATELDEATNAFVSVAWADLETQPAPDRIDRAYLHGVHRHLFRDLFSWAGKVRDVDVMAAGTSVVYCPVAEVEQRIDDAFDELVQHDFLQGLDYLDFAAKLARFWTKLTVAHPFRDGNTRSQTFVIARLAEAAGHPIAWERVDHESLRRQRMAAAQGHPEALALFIENRIEGSLW
ncbi:Fic/DOC family protein [Nocardioides panzhihuensis]|uniref:protein adenylyltransferase n=1 Tax=Nocardioides panzhihuensis TaxID=860243 RepID=A0A7Z0IV36_9ACTN|nr:Fic family protein [Nocardioides panzhihuensis]NYI80631.1 cell filamentation protein [Nocardioides panzhihuensis]